MPGTPDTQLSGAQRERDATLVRIGRARRAAIVATGGLTVGLAAFASAIAPGHTLGAKTRTHVVRISARSGAPARSLRMPALADPSQLGLQSPGSPPQAVSPPVAPAASQPASAQPAAPGQPAGAVSGGS